MKIYHCRVSSHQGSSSHYDLDSSFTDRADKDNWLQLTLSVFILWGRRFVRKEIQLGFLLILYLIAASEQQHLLPL